jgi:thiol-disulfide isomerase/thioredoxin
LASSTQFVDTILSSVHGKPSGEITRLANTFSANGASVKGWFATAAIVAFAVVFAFGTTEPRANLTASSSPAESPTDDQKSTAPKPTSAESLRKLENKFDSDVAHAFWDSVYNKRTSEVIHKNMADLTKLYFSQAIVIAKENRRDATGFEAALFIANKISQYGRGREFEEALELIGEHHLDNPRVRDLFPRVPYYEDVGMAFAHRVAEKSKNQELRGVTLFSIGSRMKVALYSEDDEAKRREGIERITAYFQKAAKEAPQAVVWSGGETTIEKAVASNLAVLKAMKSVAIGQPVPGIVGKGLDGKSINLASYAGKVVLVDIWVTWCGPCREMIPQEREMVKRLKDKPFALLSVSCDIEKEKLTAFLEKEPMPWDHCFDGINGPMVEVLHTREYPTLFLIDHTGVIRNKWVGKPDEKELNRRSTICLKRQLRNNRPGIIDLDTSAVQIRVYGSYYRVPYPRPCVDMLVVS